MAVALLRRIEESDVQCPAGYAAHCGTGVRCQIEHHTLEAATSPKSVTAYCLGDHTACPTWRAHKEAIWAQREREFTKDVESD